MTNILFKPKLLTVLCLLICFGYMSSCKKDKAENSGKVELLSFGPTGAMHGDSIIFIGNNLNKVTSIELVGATVPSSSFIEWTAERIVFIIPQLAEQGYAVLKTPEGDVTSKTRVNFEVPVTITSITGRAKPGENITIRGEYMNWVKQVVFSKDVSETTFVSRSLTELVVKVPMNAQSGTLIISTGGTEPVTIETDSSLQVTLPYITAITPNPIAREGEVTITGTDMDLVMGVSFKGVATPVTTFISQTPTQIVVKVPATANRGKLTLVAHSGVTTESAGSLLFIGDLPDLAPLSYAFYEDDLVNGWQDWGWGRTADYKNTDNVRDGNASLKLQYSGQWSGLKFANGSIGIGAYTEFTFSVFGAPGTEGKKINIVPNGGTTYTMTVTEGKWTEFKLTKAQLGLSNNATVTEVMFQNQDWTGLIYMDHVGWR